MNAQISNSSMITLAPRIRQCDKAQPVTDPASTEMMTLGIKMRTEFQNPTRTPPQFSPVQADDQALIQAAMLGAAGRVKIENVRTSSDVFNDVEITTNSGIEKNRHTHTSSV